MRPRVVGRHERAIRRPVEVLTLDHYLEVLRIKSGALPGATALSQAKAAGVCATSHEVYWEPARGDAAGTRALIEVLLTHRILAKSGPEQGKSGCQSHAGRDFRTIYRLGVALGRD